ncbi:MAG: A/G-specific adenine glycosylase [Clostridiales bacterium]|jgi:A/G-specific adenine glycosylase|nr:A/G-specific adenine glycosylase [Clostridiales bacterium]
MTDLLLNWYKHHRRDLPWRENIQPYRIWVSEIMAQQTRIAQLLPFYERFIARFPDVKALAEASEDEVLKEWAGMGYYARARNLHTAAKILLREQAGALPETAEEWRRLPGVGEYTAGAIMSIAYGAREAAVDGNALRVYARLADDATDISAPAAKKSAAAFIKAAMPTEPKRVSQFTQALMELGALICVPGREPRCGECPLERVCLSRRAGREKLLPVKSSKRPPKETDITVLLIQNPTGRVLTRRRTENLLRGMWVFYLIEKSLTEEEISGYVRSMGYTIQAWEAIGSASHVFTHRIWRMKGYAVYVHETHTVEDYAFTSKEALGQLALPKAMRFYSDWLLSLRTLCPPPVPGVEYNHFF